MDVLVTTAAGGVGTNLARYLAAEHDVRLLTTAGGDAAGERTDLCRDELSAALGGIDAIVHAANFAADATDPATERRALLSATLGTYRLCTAAREQGVGRIIVAASLNVYDTVPDAYMIDEMWRPRPTPDVHHLAPHLAAECAREFAREGGMRGMTLRFLPVGDDPDENTPFGHLCHALDRALAMEFQEDGYRWHVYHVAPGRRFLMRDAVRQLGFDTEEAEKCRQ